MLLGSWLLLVWAILGLALGPLLIVLIDWWPQKNGSVLRWPIYCRVCGTALPTLRLSALACYLLRLDSCRMCGAPVRKRNMAVELATAVLFGGLFLRFGLTLPLFIYSLYACVLVVVFIIDFEHRLIPNVITYPSILFALLLGFFVPGLGEWRGLLGGLFYGGMFLVLYLLALAIYRNGGAFGLGDVKLALLIGLITGLKGAVIAAFLGTLIGGLLAVGVLISRRVSSKAAMPYGPALVLGALATIMWRPWIG